MPPLVVALAALVGLAVGPLLTVAADRVPGRDPLTTGVAGRALVPVWSWFGAPAAARGGGARRRRDLGIDLAAAAGFAAMAVVAASPAQLVGLCAAAAGFVVLGVIDLEHHRLPDLVVFPTLGVVLGAAVAGVIGGDPVDLLTGALVGATAEFVLFLVMAIATPGWVGLGDVKLALLLGAVCGWVGAAQADAVAGPIATALVVTMYGLLFGSGLAVVFGLVRSLLVRARWGLRPVRSRHVALVGPMGSGKSALGAWVAGAVGRPFVDVDADIEATAGRTIADIFAADGEPAFRALEAAAVTASLDAPRAAIIATGGGAVLDPDTRSRLRERAAVVWLDAEPHELGARVGDAAGRPLLAGDPGRLAQLRAEREPLYREVAHARLDTTGLPEAEARRRLDQIVSGLLGYFPFGPPLLVGTVLACLVAGPLLG
ncbi:MAG TPA: shikimate kinase [Acidimicrobiales bacterium]|nr:shikimate kinase [Acidimicrobiales bacterium]